MMRVNLTNQWSARLKGMNLTTQWSNVVVRLMVAHVVRMVV